MLFPSLFISIHAPPRGATNQKFRAISESDLFQFTPLREGRREDVERVLQEAKYFNSRPSARGDYNRHMGGKRADISIHAPPRGATEKSPVAMPCTNFNSRPSARGDSAFPAWCPPCVISIHAPPRGATIPAHRLCTSHKNFNSRPSARGDLTAPLLSSVSTHFNSRPSARGDPRLMMAGWYPAEFQFTPLREGRRAWAPALHRRADFNSRPSARGD